MRTLRASELGAYLYCQRLWWYQRLGLKPENQAELEAGQQLHERHGRQALRLGLLRLAAWLAFLLALALLTAYLVGRWL